MFTQFVVVSSIIWALLAVKSLFEPKPTNSQQQLKDNEIAIPEVFEKLDAHFSPQAMLMGSVQAINPEASMFKNHPLQPLLQLFNSVRNGDYNTRRESEYTVIRHDNIKASIWAFDRSGKESFIILDLGGTSVINFTWYRNGTIKELEDRAHLLSELNTTAFCHELRLTLHLLESVLSKEKESSVKRHEKINLLANEKYNEPKKVPNATCTPASLAAKNTDIRRRFDEIASLYQKIQPYLSNLDIEAQHHIERITENTYPHLVYAFCQLDTSFQKENMPTFLSGLQNIHDELERHLYRLNQNKAHEFEKRMRLTELSKV